MEEGVFDIPGIIEHKPQMASEDDIRLAHVCLPSVRKVATESHLIAAGGTIIAAQKVMNQETDRAFALLRPPGHHGMRIVHGSRGFCVLNNEAIMIERLRSSHGGDLRIAVVDTDAHHADGTQDIYYNDPGVLHISIHQDGRTLYPGTGDPYELGGPGAYGTTLNVPLPPGSGDQEILYVMENLVQPALKDFQPDLVVNAAGQDNHFTDPLTDMNVTAQGYAELTKMLAPDIVVLEGGYSIEGALPYVNLGILLALAGLDYSKVCEPVSDERDFSFVSGVNPKIRETVAFLQTVWSKRREIDLGKIFGTGSFFERRRQIYYDTDHLLEEQEEEIRLCPNCSGYRKILSSVQRRRGTQATVIIIPRRACNSCRTEAENAFDRINPGEEIDYVCLQDPEKERYLQKS